MIEILKHPRVLACGMPFIQQWAAGGAVKPSADLPYSAVVRSGGGAAAGGAAAGGVSQSAARRSWAEQHLQWQRWVVGGVDPAPAAAAAAAAAMAAAAAPAAPVVIELD